MGENSKIEWTDHKSKDRRVRSQLIQAAQRTGVDVETWKLMRELGKSWCIDCRQWLSVGSFNKDSSRRFGLQQYCKPCCKVRHVSHRYSMTKKEASEFLSRNECEICHRSNVAFEVDHDHATGKVRGLLCSRCNSAIGLLLEDPALIDAAKVYLERHSIQLREHNDIPMVKEAA